jgi:hypothetical protein
VRSAEAAGLNGGQVIRAAISGRPFDGTRSHAAVLDARIRDTTGRLPPKVGASWADRLPSSPESDLGRYLADIAAAMDDRQRRIGEHAAREAPLWATQALGQVPADPAGRPEWELKAGRLGAYREMFGWDHPADAIGPEPAPTFPEARAEWHAAFAVMARIEGIDVRNLSEGQLLARRRSYQAETSWAPNHVAEELRAARRQEQHSQIEANRHRHEAAAAARRGNPGQAGLHQHAAQSWTALRKRAAQVRQMLAEAHDTRCQWEVMTEPTRRLARAADIELERRGVLGRDDTLTSAEPHGLTYTGLQEHSAEVWIQPRLDGTVENGHDPYPPADPGRHRRMRGHREGHPRRRPRRHGKRLPQARPAAHLPPREESRARISMPNSREYRQMVRVRGGTATKSQCVLTGEFALGGAR